MRVKVLSRSGSGSAFIPAAVPGFTEPDAGMHEGGAGMQMMR